MELEGNIKLSVCEKVC